jgi:Uma2 family endonuclease
MREEAITSVVPDLAIEVISRTNTAEEMHEKLNDYFNAGVRSVWYAYPSTRTVDVYSSPTDRRVVQEPAILEDTTVLPGLQINLTELFDLGGLLA